ncbi:unnamed protein product [Cylindrotheca closterium]|uniref:Subtilisin n=1 Tax=Cylindrotheca closterium TaxID=2856 RepID=A0AAD2PW62_9STRA|nr:unnamed protein product [Cylindrotheca closterium]
MVYNPVYPQPFKRRMVAASSSLLAIVALSSIASTTGAPVVETPLFGFQTGPLEGPLYAGELFYDDSTDKIYISGEIYQANSQAPESECLLMTFDRNTLDLIKSKAYGNPNTLDFCSSMTLSSDNHLMVVGNSAPGGWSDQFKLTNTNGSNKLNGFMAVLNKDDLSAVSSTHSGLMMETADLNTNIPYPRDILSDDNGNVWVVSLTSTDSNANPSESAFADWLTEDIQYGSSTYMTITKFSYGTSAGHSISGISTGSNHLSMDFTKEYPVDTPSDGTVPPRVFVGGLLLKDIAPVTVNAAASTEDKETEFLVVAGSTRGKGTGYGQSQGTDEDGFLTLIDKTTGNLLDLTSPVAVAAGITTNNARIGTYADDIITGLCNDPNDPDSFFIVGATQARFGDALQDDAGPNIPETSLRGFISKISLTDLKAKWTRHFKAVQPNPSQVSEVYAMDCLVDDDQIFVSGNVESGGSVYDVSKDRQLPAKGGSDMWFAAMDLFTLEVDWVRQIGTVKDDRLAEHGSMDMTEDLLMVLGETNGNFYRERAADEKDASTDIVLIALGTDTGRHKHPIGQKGDQIIKAPDEEDEDDDWNNADDDDDSVVGQIKWEPRGAQLKGPLYAGGMVYDSEKHMVEFTGGSYLEENNKSMCFTGTWDLTTGQVNKIYLAGTDFSEEACNAIAWSPTDNLAYSVGFTESTDQGFFDYMTAGADRADNVKVMGTILQTNANGRPVGGGIIDQEVVQYPVAAVTHPTEDYIFVASSASTNSTEHGNMPAAVAHPDLTTGGTRRFGDKFFVGVSRYQVIQKPKTPAEPLSQTLEESWYKAYNVGDHAGVAVTGMAMAGAGANTLVAVGSTKGSGLLFGKNTGDDFDGFVLKINPENGEGLTFQPEDKASTRVDSSDHKDDWINNICVDKFNPDFIYIVGGTKGKIRSLDDEHQLPEGDIHAWIAKMSLDTLDVTWVKHFTMQAGPGATIAEASAFACSIAPGEDTNSVVYIAGTILGGAVMDNAIEGQSGGGDDMFIIQMDDDGQTVNWIRQVGTADDDRLAASGGLDIDAEGNAILYGETTGAFYSTTASGTNDIVAFTMQKKDGAYYGLGTGAPPITIGSGGTTVPPPVDLDGDGMEDVKVVDPNEKSDDDHLDDDAHGNDDDNIVPDNILAVQTGPDSGPTYAGGMAYDEWTNSIYLTGATYGSFTKPGSDKRDSSYCFFGVMTLPSLEWKDRETFGTNSAVEACSALALTKNDNKSGVAIAGSTEANGLLTSQSEKTDTQYEMLLDLLDVNDAYGLVGGQAVDDEVIQFPAAIVSSGDTIYVASMFSTDERITADYDKASQEYPNFTTGGIEKYGSQYGVAVEQFKIQREDTTLGSGIMQKSFVRQWRRPFETTAMSSVFVSGMIAVGNELIVVGSTRASPKGNDMDGIMARVNTADGNFVGTLEGDNSVAYFESADGADDWIMNACADSESAHDHFYVVGATASKAQDANTINAMIAKISLDNLTPIWTKELEVLHASGDITKHAAAVGLGCDVIPGNHGIYIAGTVENGARLNYPSTQSAGRDDIFVAKIDPTDGRTIWLDQFGSNGDDRLARAGGVKVNQNGNAVVYGDTNGDFYRWNPEHSRDLFVVVMDQKSGAFQKPLVGATWPPDTSAPREWFGVINLEGNTNTIAIVVSLLVILCVVIGVLCLRNKKKKSESQKTSIFAYLQRFDVEDIDLRRSPPGGWHGTYLNKLAYGINGAESGSRDHLNHSYDESRPLTHSSVVSDSLFMDQDIDTPASYDNLQRHYRDGSESRPGMEII